MERRIENIRREKSELDKEDYSKIPTRQFLLLNIMPILTKGMLEVCKINPIDPIDYLANYLFKNSTD
jgi:adenylate kinase